MCKSIFFSDWFYKSPKIYFHVRLIKPKQHVHFRLEKEQLERLRELSKETDITVSTLIRCLINDYILQFSNKFRILTRIKSL